MKNFAEFLDQIKKEKGITSDRQLAKMLNVPQQYVDRYRKGTEPSEEFCNAIAEFSGRNPAEVWIIAKANKASNTMKSRIEKLLKNTAAAAIFVILIALTSLNSPILYIMSNR